MTNDSTGRIVDDLRRWISAAAPGSRLPSSRDLVARYAASPVTVQKALRRLAAEGLTESRPGVGTFARAERVVRAVDYGWQSAALRTPRFTLPRSSQPLRTAPAEAYALHGGYPEPGLLPERLVRAALGRAARSTAATSRPPTAGLPDLRAWFAAELAALTAAGTPAPSFSDVVITPGSQSALTSITRALVPPGGALLIESPTYWGAIHSAHLAGVRLVPVRGDSDGPDLDELDRTFRETGARAFYAQPNYANPTGAQWSPERARAVLDVVRDRGAFLIEDDWAHDLAITTEPRPVAVDDHDGHVVYVRSLTKSMSPAVRVAAVIARGPARERILADQAAESAYVSAILQATALDVVSDPGWATHLRRLRRALKERRDLLAASLTEHAPALEVGTLPPGGIHLWGRLPAGTDVHRLVRDCEAASVYVAAGDEWFSAEPAGPYLRLNFTGPNPAGFTDAAKVIGEAILAQR